MVAQKRVTTPCDMANGVPLLPNADALLIASAMRAVDGFIDQVVDHVRGVNDPVTAIVECVSFALDTLTGDLSWRADWPGDRTAKRSPR